MEKRIALVTGGNRGLGLETCRRLGQLGYTVILTSRDVQKGQQKADELKEEGLLVEFAQLDVADPKSIDQLYQTVKAEWGKLDVLVNNAAILLDKESPLADHDSTRFRREVLEKTLNTNVVGVYDLCEHFIPMMINNSYGRIVNVSSGAGQLSQPHTYYIAYSISKTALNGITCFLGARLKGHNVLMNSVCPGWVRTDMGGDEAPRSIDEGVEGIIWAATLPNGGPNGGFFRDGKPISW